MRRSIQMITATLVGVLLASLWSGEREVLTPETATASGSSAADGTVGKEAQNQQMRVGYEGVQVLASTQRPSPETVNSTRMLNPREVLVQNIGPFLDPDDDAPMPGVQYEEVRNIGEFLSPGGQAIRSGGEILDSGPFIDPVSDYVAEVTEHGASAINNIGEFSDPDDYYGSSVDALIQPTSKGPFMEPPAY